MKQELQFPGNDRVRLLLEQALATDQVGGAWLFEGAPGAGQEQAAVAVAAAFLAGHQDEAAAGRVRRFSHPDFHYYLPLATDSLPKPVAQMSGDDLREFYRAFTAPKSGDPYWLPEFKGRPYIHIQTLRMIERLVHLRPFEGSRKVVLLRDVDQMDASAPDTMLKILEEPPSGTLILLTSSRSALLKPTILSRCHRFSFDPLPAAVIASLLTERHLPVARADELATLADGNMELALRMAAAESEEGNAYLQRRDEWFEVLDACELGSELEMMDAVSSLVKRKGPRGASPVLERAEFLGQAIGWYRDLLRVATGAGPPQVNRDRQDRAASWAHLSDEMLLERIARAESARTQILGYAHAEMTLLALFFSLRGRAARKMS